MDIYKLDSNPNKFCVKYGKVNDFTINKEKDKIFECSKGQKVYEYLLKIIDRNGLGLLKNQIDIIEKYDILFDGSNNTNYSNIHYYKSRVNKCTTIDILLKVLRKIFNNQLYLSHNDLYRYDGMLDRAMLLLKPNIMDDINVAKKYKKCMIYKDFIQSKLCDFLIF